MLFTTLEASHVRSYLSHQSWWRDKAVVPRQRPTQTRKAYISVLVAWQVNVVAPLPTARQSKPVTPGMVARQGCCAAPTVDADQKGLHFSHVGARAQACRATRNGATSIVPRKLHATIAAACCCLVTMLCYMRLQM